MSIGVDSLNVCFAGSEYGLSALRFLEHTELGQINPFGRTIPDTSPGHECASITLIAQEGRDFVIVHAFDRRRPEFQPGKELSHWAAL